MKKLLICLSALSLILINSANSAYASKSGKSKTYSSVSSQWSGFYLGGDLGIDYDDIKAKTTVANNGGYFTGNDGQLIAATGKQDRHTIGGLAGFDLGYNWNYSHYIFGLETDANWFYINSSKSETTQYQTLPGSFFTIQSKVQSNWLLTIHPKFAYSFRNYLLYVTGGLAISDVTYKYKFTDTGFSALQNSSDIARFGWVVGTGIEAKVARQWSTKVSYEYIQFQRKNVTGSVANSGGFAPAQLEHQSQMHSNVISFGVNYYFSNV